MADLLQQCARPVTPSTSCQPCAGRRQSSSARARSRPARPASPARAGGRAAGRAHRSVPHALRLSPVAAQAPWERFAAPLERGEDFVVRRARLRAANGDLTCGDWDLHFRRGPSSASP
jgi:hypothetical protein